MSLAIVINQAGKPAGVDGQAREDLVTGVSVSLAAVGGPFLAYQWTWVSKPIDILAGAMANPLFGTSAASSTTASPITIPGTYEVQLAVDSGSGLGALDSDVVRITFYAGIAGNYTEGAVNVDPAELPRRRIAFSETIEHNVPDVIEPSGNTQGWSREWYRWFALLTRFYQAKSFAHGRVIGSAGSPSLLNGMNVVSPTWISTGVVKMTFLRPMPDGNYSVIACARGSGGMASARAESPTDFIVERADIGGSLVDEDFTFDVHYLPV